MQLSCWDLQTGRASPHLPFISQLSPSSPSSLHNVKPLLPFFFKFSFFVHLAHSSAAKYLQLFPVCTLGPVLQLSLNRFTCLHVDVRVSPLDSLHGPERSGVSEGKNMIAAS